LKVVGYRAKAVPFWYKPVEALFFCKRMWPMKAAQIVT